MADDSGPLGGDLASETSSVLLDDCQLASQRECSQFRRAEPFALLRYLCSQLGYLCSQLGDQRKCFSLGFAKSRHHCMSFEVHGPFLE